MRSSRSLCNLTRPRSARFAQGAERDVIILSTAVTKPGPFASDACRLNVALTRARHNLLIVGHASALQSSAPAFAALLRRCRSTAGGYAPNGQLPLPALAQRQELRQQAPAAGPPAAAAAAGGGGPALLAPQGAPALPPREEAGAEASLAHEDVGEAEEAGVGDGADASWDLL